MVIPTTPARETARSRELATRLRSAIAEYSKANPKLTQADIDAALRAVRETDAGDADTRRRMAVLTAVVAAIIAALGGGIVNAAERGRALLIPALGLGVVLLALGAVVFVRWRDRS